jgi:hypothetical protein
VQILPYLEQLFERDMIHVSTEPPLCIPRAALTPVYAEWVARLQHPHFGLSTFFVVRTPHLFRCPHPTTKFQSKSVSAPLCT